MRNRFSLLIVILACVLLSWGPFSALAANESFPKVVSLGTGSVGGGYNMVGVGAARIWDKELGLKAMVVPGVAVANLHRFAEGRLDIVVSPSSFSKAAWEGLKDFKFSKPVRTFRVLCYIFPDFFHFVAKKNSGLKNVSDLKGKRVGCGPAAPTYDKIIGKRLEANGIKYFGDNPDIKKVFANYSDLARLLADGNLDATLMGVSGVVPFPALQQLMAEQELVALEWNKSAVDYKDPIFPMGTIKKEILPYLEKDHICPVGGIASFIIRQEYSDEFAYALTKSIHQNLSKLAKDNPYFKYPERYPEILTYDAGIPYHPGAIKYWKEVGAWKR
jgi:uncharacterized protein